MMRIDLASQANSVFIEVLQQTCSTRRNPTKRTHIMSNTAAPSTTQVAEQLRDIQLELIDLLDRAKELLRTAPSITRERAESYWLAHARMAITKNHSYLGGSMVDMDDTIAEMEGADGEDDES
jgi:hypothetical protein